MNRSAFEQLATPHGIKTANSQTPPSHTATAPTVATTAVAAPAGALVPLAPQRSNETALEHVGTIAKCQIEGKIVYTDKGCPRGSNAETLQFTDNAIIPGYDRATVENTLRHPPQPAAQATAPVSVIGPTATIGTEPDPDCATLRRRFQWLDYNYSRARHGQAPHIRDRMRRERDDVQTQMFWGRC